MCQERAGLMEAEAFVWIPPKQARVLSLESVLIFCNCQQEAIPFLLCCLSSDSL